MANRSQSVIRGRDVAVIGPALRIGGSVRLPTRSRTYIGCVRRIRNRCRVDKRTVAHDLLARVVFLCSCHRKAEPGSADGEYEVDRNRETEVITGYGYALIARNRGRGGQACLYRRVLIENAAVDRIEIDGLLSGEVLLLRD